jgi:lysophospholipase L1-like esterase
VAATCGALAIGGLWWFTAAAEDVEWALWRRYSASAVGLNMLGSALISALAYMWIGRGTLAQRLVRVALVGGSVAFTLAALELPALLGHDYGRMFGTHENDTWLQLATGVNRRDDQLIHVHQPHSRYQGAVVGNLVRLGIPSPRPYPVDVSYDRNGFRNAEDFTEAEVVVIGDSFVEGAETPHAETVVAGIGRQLGVTAVNLGQSHYGPQQELVVLERYGIPLSPRLVVWFFFGGNDLTDAEGYEWQVRHLDELVAPPSFGSRSFSRHALRALARATTPRRRVETPLAARHAAVYAPPGRPPQRMYLDTNEEPWSARQWQLVTDVLVKARDATGRANAEFLLVYIPRKLRVYQGFLQSEPGAFAREWQPNDLPDVLGEWCRAQDIPYLNSTVALRGAVASGESVYLPDDVHWNPAGHRVVATAVVERLRQLPSVTGKAAR